MLNNTARIVGWLLRLVLPSPGRHRVADARLEERGLDTPTLSLPRVPHGRVRPSLRGEDIGLVRPYVVAHERQRQSPRRAELVCAPHGMAVIR